METPPRDGERRPVPEAPLEPTEAGLVAAGPGWFVLNAAEARWIERPGRGVNLPFTGWTDQEAETWFRELGVNLVRLSPGEPIGMYHWEDEAEDFLVLAGEALLLVEGSERALRRWDFVHCPPETRHMIVGAGEEPCLVLAVGSRANQSIGPWGAYTVEESALRHGAGVEAETQDARTAYARFPAPQPSRYRDGWLPSLRA